MATTVYTTEEVALSDGTVVELKPLNIKPLRLFMKKINEFADAQNEDEGLDTLLDAGALCLSKQKPEYYDAEKYKDDKDRGDKTLGGYTEEFEEVMDMETLYKVLEVCGGVKLNDPNLLRAATEALTRETGSL